MRTSKINRAIVATSVTNLATAFGVTEAQIATYIFTNFYRASKHKKHSEKMRYYLTCAQNLNDTL